MKQQPATIVQPWLERSPVFDRIEIESQFCSAEGFSETSLPIEFPRRVPDKAFHNQARGAVAIPSWPANPGLYSSREVGVWWLRFLATIFSFCAISARAAQSNSWQGFSPLATLAAALKNTVFTHTQLMQKMRCIFACIGLASMIKL